MHWDKFISPEFLQWVKGEKYGYYYIWYLAETLLQRSNIMSEWQNSWDNFYLNKIYNLTENARWKHPIHSV